MDQINNVSLYNLTKFLSLGDQARLGQVNKKLNSRMKLMPFFKEIDEICQTPTNSDRNMKIDIFMSTVCILFMYISWNYNLLSSLAIPVFIYVIKRHFAIPSIATFDFGIKINIKLIDGLLFLPSIYQNFCLFCIPSIIAQKILYSSYLEIIGMFYYLYIVNKMKTNKYKKILLKAISLYKNEIARWIIEDSKKSFSLNDMKIIKANVLYYDNDFIYEFMNIEFKIRTILKTDSVRIFARYIQLNPGVNYQTKLSDYKAEKIKNYLKEHNM